MKFKKSALASLHLALICGESLPTVEATDRPNELQYEERMRTGVRNLGGGKKTLRKSNAGLKKSNGDGSRRFRSRLRQPPWSVPPKGKGKGKGLECDVEEVFLSDRVPYELRSTFLIDCNIDVVQFVEDLKCIVLEVYNGLACNDSLSSFYRRIVSVIMTIVEIVDSTCVTTIPASGGSRHLSLAKQTVITDLKGELDSTDCTSCNPAESDELFEDALRRERRLPAITSTADPCGSFPTIESVLDGISSALAAPPYNYDVSADEIAVVFCKLCDPCEEPDPLTCPEAAYDFCCVPPASMQVP